MSRICTALYIKLSRAIADHLQLILFAVGLSLLYSGLTGVVVAQSGGEIFETAACNLLEKLLNSHFGAMLTAIAGALAIVASVVGSFKGAWALIFVSVGCYIAPMLIGELFPDLYCTISG